MKKCQLSLVNANLQSVLYSFNVLKKVPLQTQHKEYPYISVAEWLLALWKMFSVIVTLEVAFVAKKQKKF
jgi:hypothetical protein